MWIWFRLYVQLTRTQSSLRTYSLSFNGQERAKARAKRCMCGRHTKSVSPFVRQLLQIITSNWNYKVKNFIQHLKITKFSLIKKDVDRGHEEKRKKFSSALEIQFLNLSGCPFFRSQFLSNWNKTLALLFYVFPAKVCETH